MVMSAFKFVLDVGLQFIPGVGKALDAGLGKLSYAREPSGEMKVYVLIPTWQIW